MKTQNFAKLIRQKLAKDADLARLVEEESFNANIATEIYAARTEAGLTQQQLADRIGTSQSVIARLEDSDYDSHSLTTLRKIAEALKKQLRVEFYAPQTFASVNELEAHVEIEPRDVTDPFWSEGKWQPEVDVRQGTFSIG